MTCAAKICASCGSCSTSRLRLIAHQLKAEVVVDRDSFASPAFASEGGFHRIDKDFGGKLGSLLGELAEEVWSDAG